MRAERSATDSFLLQEKSSARGGRRPGEPPPEGYPQKPMLDPRIYRNGMMIVVLALIVLAFSLGSQAAPMSADLVPDAFNGRAAYGIMTSLAASYPDRRPGSAGDERVADYVAT